MSKRSKYHVYANTSPRPNSWEISAAELVSEFLHADVKFIRAGHAKTPDLLIANQRWEIKSPIGTKPSTIRHQFQRASRQANYLIFDARRIKMLDSNCRHRVQYEFRLSRNIKRLVYISQDDLVYEFFK